MSNVRIESQTLTDIADSIRSKLGVQTTYKPSDMATAIDSIPTQSQPVLQDRTVIPMEQQQTVSADSGYDGLGTVTVEAIETEVLTVTQNGNYTPSANKYFDNVEVDVPTNEIYFTANGKSYPKVINFPSTVTSIGQSAYENCTELKSVTMTNNITSIELSAFRGCSNLETINISNSIAAINGYTFTNCSNLTSIVIPHGVITVGYSAFSGCSSLVNITLPSSITTFSTPSSTFSRCTALKNVTLSNGFLATIQLSASTQFTADDIVAMFNALGTVPSGETRTFTLGATNLAKLSNEQKEIATDKGWTLS